MTQTEQLIRQMPDPDLFADWQLWDDRKDYAVERERALRAELVRRYFPDPKEGANKFKATLQYADHTKEVAFTMTHKIERKVDETLLDSVFAQPQLVGYSRDKLIKLKPELAIKEYRALPDEVKPFFEVCLTIKPGSPQLAVKVEENE